MEEIQDVLGFLPFLSYKTTGILCKNYTHPGRFTQFYIPLPQTLKNILFTKSSSYIIVGAIMDSGIVFSLYVISLI